MFLELVAVIVAGIAAGGILFLARRLTGGRLPGWLVPAAAGLAMIAATIANEYGWYGRTAAALPAGVEVIDRVELRQMWRPWTYVVPMTGSFIALDRSGLRQNPAQPGVYLADLYLFARWQAPGRLSVAVDCPGRRHALLGPAAEFGPDGSIDGATWAPATEGDPLIAAICDGGA